LEKKLEMIDRMIELILGIALAAMFKLTSIITREEEDPLCKFLLIMLCLLATAGIFMMFYAVMAALTEML
jgi:hypothetical protein